MYTILTLLLAYATSSGFAYNTVHVHSAECGQGDPLQDEQLMEDLKRVYEQLGPPGCNLPKKPILSRDSLLFSISFLRLSQDKSSQWLTSGGLL